MNKSESTHPALYYYIAPCINHQTAWTALLFTGLTLDVEVTFDHDPIVVIGHSLDSLDLVICLGKSIGYHGYHYQSHIIQHYFRSYAQAPVISMLDDTR